MSKLLLNLGVQKTLKLTDFIEIDVKSNSLFLKDDDEKTQNFIFEMSGDGTNDNFIELIQNELKPHEAYIRVVEKIDREDPYINNLNGKLPYKIKISDENNNFNEKNITVEITDINDCSPHFTNPNENGRYEKSISELTENDTTIFLLDVTDADITENFHTGEYLTYTFHKKFRHVGTKE